ncbi:hypothetical protein [Phaeobacter italicus]|jgi:hypothetical protein|uniref:hypothetical protein n=1 Tax=Phaeobacter italicus TaxID=481446 RepID=UPI002FDE745E
MSDDKITELFPGQSSGSVDAIAEQAENECERLMCIGFTEDGQLVIKASGNFPVAEMMLAMELTKQIIIDDALA